MKSDGDPLISAKRFPQSKLTPHSKHSQLTEIVVVDPLIRAKSLPVQQIDYLAESHSQFTWLVDGTHKSVKRLPMQQTHPIEMNSAQWVSLFIYPIQILEDGISIILIYAPKV